MKPYIRKKTLELILLVGPSYIVVPIDFQRKSHRYDHSSIWRARENIRGGMERIGISLVSLHWLFFFTRPSSSRSFAADVNTKELVIVDRELLSLGVSQLGIIFTVEQQNTFSHWGRNGE